MQPASIPSPEEWSKFEHEIGIEVPLELKKLIQTYGVGCFDQFLWLYTPVSENLHLNTRAKTELRHATLKEYWSGRTRKSFAIHPDPEGLIVWGGTDNGDALCFKTVGEVGNVVVNQGSLHEWEDTHLPIPQFLRDVFARSYTCRLFPDDFPSRAPNFVAHK